MFNRVVNSLQNTQTVRQGSKFMSSTVSSYQDSQSFKSQAPISRAEDAHRTSKQSSTNDGGFRLTGSQVIVLWSIMAGLLIMCFLFGFYAGRQQGLKVAFEQYSGQAARIPIVDPVASQHSVNRLLPDVSEKELAASEATEDESKFDFSAEGKVAPTRGNAAKSKAAPVAVSVAQSAPSNSVTPAPAAGSSSAVSGVAAGWYIQIAATKTSNEADEVVAKIAKHSYSAQIDTAQVGTRLFYRVLVGPYSSRVEAEKQRGIIAKRKLTRAAPFLKRVR